jgi:glycosyltransferase involved in cell wall biosynthesis
VKRGREKWPYYSSADINCFPTFYEAESFGVVAIEAMMFENPIVATNWRALPEIIEDGETGYLVPIQDVDALSEKLEVLIKDHALRRRMGQNGRKKYLREYTIHKYLANFENAIINSFPKED